MRQAVIVASALFLIGCGPDPNAQLPGLATQAKTGGATGTGSGGSVPSGGGGAGGTPKGSGGVVGTGGTTSKGGSGGGNPFAGGTTGSTGGVVSSGGVVGSGGMLVGSGGAASSGGVIDAGGKVGSGGQVGSGGGGGGRAGTGGVLGSGGATTPSSGALTTYSFGSGAEPCTPTKDISGGSTGNLGTAAICFRTADDLTDWNCSNADDRTIKINTVAVKCGSAAPAASAPPPKEGSFYYFDISAGKSESASIYWYYTKQGFGPHPVPACGHYPPWASGGSASPCADSSGAIDAGP